MFQDRFGDYDYRSSVMALTDEGWRFVGARGFGWNAEYISLALGPDGTPYAVFQEFVVGWYRLSLRRMDPVNGWVYVGGQTFTPGGAGPGAWGGQISMEVAPNGHVFVAFQDWSVGAKNA